MTEAMIPRIEWNRLWTATGASGNMTAPFEKLVRCYSMPRRHYHTLTHVMWVLRRIDEIIAAGRDFAGITLSDRVLALKWAAWFHDAVMSGEANDEEFSADLAEKGALAAKLPVAFADRVRWLVLSTGHDREVHGDTAILCDADIAILGADDEHFDEYERLVRKEWEHVSDNEFAKGRTTILRRFLDKPTIYATHYGREHWETKARANLERSIAQLAVTR